MSFDEVLEKLRTLEETILVDLLEITSDDIVDAFHEQILDKYDYIKHQIEP
jgi:hypothetical protein